MSRCSCAADNRAVGGCAEYRVSTQNPAGGLSSSSLAFHLCRQWRNTLRKTEVSSQYRVRQRVEERSVGREGISGRRVEQIVDVPAGQMAEASQSPGETVELRKKFLEMYSDRDLVRAMSWNGRFSCLKRDRSWEMMC